MIIRLGSMSPTKSVNADPLCPECRFSIGSTGSRSLLDHFPQNIQQAAITKAQSCLEHWAVRQGIAAHPPHMILEPLLRKWSLICLISPLWKSPSLQHQRTQHLMHLEPQFTLALDLSHDWKHHIIQIDCTHR